MVAPAIGGLSDTGDVGPSIAVEVFEKEVTKDDGELTITSSRGQVP